MGGSTTVLEKKSLSILKSAESKSGEIPGMYPDPNVHPPMGKQPNKALYIVGNLCVFFIPKKH